MDGGGGDVESKDEALRWRIAIRGAKAANLLSSLKLGTNRDSRNHDRDQEKEKLRRAIMNLKVELAMERLRNKRIKLCGLAEIILQALVLISLSGFFIIMAFNAFDV